MNGSRKSRKSKSKEDEGRNREKEWERVGECDKRHNVLWDAFGHSEHLSKQGSLNGRLTNGYGRERQRGGRGGERHTSLLLHVHSHKSHMHTKAQQCGHFFCLQQIIDTRFVQSYSVIAIELFWRSCMSACVRVCVCIHAPDYVGFCVQAQCVHVYLPTVVFGCQILSTISHCDELGAVSISHLNCFFFPFFIFFKALWAELCSLSISLSLALSPFLSVLLSLYKKHP